MSNLLSVMPPLLSARSCCCSLCCQLSMCVHGKVKRSQSRHAGGNINFFHSILLLTKLYCGSMKKLWTTNRLWEKYSNRLPKGHRVVGLWGCALKQHYDREALPDMLFKVTWLLIGFAAKLAFVWPVTAHHVQVLLERQTGVLGRDETC